MPLQTIIDFLNANQGKPTALVCHQRPDGDALGSAIALADVLTRRGTPTHVVNPGKIPQYLQFLCTDNNLIAIHPEPDWHRHYACLGILDCGETSRLPPENRTATEQLPTFNIDHHVTSDGVGSALWIQPDASSTGEMVAKLCQTAGWEISPLAATALWTAIVTDTGRFCYENTSVPSLEAALFCMRHGADPARAAEQIYQSVTWTERQLQRTVLDKMELHHDGMTAMACLTREEFRRANSGVEGAQNLVNLLRDTAGVNVAAFLYEPPEPGDPELPIKVSFRTRTPYSALDIVRQYGGGGHERAAGCSLPGPMESARETILKAIDAAWFNA